ncbi:hypothetical protein [Saccharopolyspora sp. NPDC002376]
MLDGVEGTSFNLSNSTVSGFVSICNGKLISPGGEALRITTSEVSGDLTLTDLELTGGGCKPADGGDAGKSSVDLLVATVHLSDTTIRGRLHAGAGFSCSGEVRLVNLVVPHVTFHGAVLESPGALVISGSNLTVDSLVLSKMSADGGVVLASSEIRHVLRITSATGGDEAEEAWRVVTSVLSAWSRDLVPLQEYPAGSEGPS